MVTASVFDGEFGEITVRRMAASRRVCLRVQPDGRLTATMPLRGRLGLVTRLLDAHRAQLRQVIQRQSPATGPQYRQGQKVGARHSLRFVYAEVAKPRASVRSGEIAIKLPPELSPDDSTVQAATSRAIHRVLQTEASLYLPRRLGELSAKTGIAYQSLGFGNAKGRWGSCTSRGEIRLNIALMKLPPSLSDYVMIHELCHVVHLNHSVAFWQEVERHYPTVSQARRRLRDYSPYI